MWSMWSMWAIDHIGPIDHITHILIMAFLAFQAADVGNGDFVPFAVFEFLVISFVLFVIIVSFKLHLRFAVAVDAPAHTEGRILVHNIHLLYGAMALLAGYLADSDVLGVIEISVVGQVVYTNPFNRSLNFAIGIILQRLNNPFPLSFHHTTTGVVHSREAVGGHILLTDPFFVQVFNLFVAPVVVILNIDVRNGVETDGSVNFGDFCSAALGAFFHGRVAVHTGIGCRNYGLFGGSGGRRRGKYWQSILYG